MTSTSISPGLTLAHFASNIAVYDGHTFGSDSYVTDDVLLRVESVAPSDLTLYADLHKSVLGAELQKRPAVVNYYDFSQVVPLRILNMFAEARYLLKSTGAGVVAPFEIPNSVECATQRFGKVLGHDVLLQKIEKFHTSVVQKKIGKKESLSGALAGIYVERGLKGVRSALDQVFFLMGNLAERGLFIYHSVPENFSLQGDKVLFSNPLAACRITPETLKYLREASHFGGYKECWERALAVLSMWGASDIECYELSSAFSIRMNGFYEPHHVKRLADWGQRPSKYPRFHRVPDVFPLTV